MSKTADRSEQALNATLAPIIKSLEDGIANPDKWSAPWHHVDADLMSPYCPATDRHYTAGNRFMLAMSSMVFGAEPHWGTFRQWKGMSKHTAACNKSATNVDKRGEKRPDCGGGCEIVTVRKGEKAIASAFRPLFRKVENDDGTERQMLYGFSPYAVFHSGQVDGYTIARDETPATSATDAEDIAAAFEFAKLVGATVIEDDFAGASYSPVLDRIVMPSSNRWKDGIGCWATLAHEMSHWTGHESRLNREISNRFGSDAYAAEELIAELGSAFTLAKLGRSAEPRDDHAHYLASWLRVLKADSKHLLTVASHAEKASGFILDAAAADEPMMAEAA